MDCALFLSKLLSLIVGITRGVEGRGGGGTFYILLCTPFIYHLLSNGTSCTYLKNFESPLTAGSALSFKSK